MSFKNKPDVQWNEGNIKKPAPLIQTNPVQGMIEDLGEATPSMYN